MFSQTAITDVLKRAAAERVILFNWRGGEVGNVTQCENETCVTSKIEKVIFIVIVI